MSVNPSLLKSANSMFRVITVATLSIFSFFDKSTNWPDSIPKNITGVDSVTFNANPARPPVTMKISP